MVRFVAVIALLAAMIGVSAQGDTPVVLMEAGDFRALAVTADDAFLLAADEATQQVRVYDLADLAAPVMVNSIDVGGRPFALATSDGFALAAVESSFSPTTIEVMAPDRFNSAGVYAAGENFVDLPFAAVGLVRSSQREYAVAYGPDAFALMHLRAAGEIDTRVFDMGFDAAAATADVVVFAQGSALGVLPIASIDALAASAIFDAGADVLALAVSDDGSLAAAALINGTVLLFDPATLNVFASASVPGVEALTFATSNRLPFLAVADGGAVALLFDVSARNLEPVNASLSVGGTIQAMAALDGHLVITDGATIGIFALP